MAGLTDRGAVQAALEFIARVRADAALRDRIRDEAADGDLDEVVRLGAECGLHFTADDLRAAFRQDWTMRSLLHGPGASSGRGA